MHSSDPIAQVSTPMGEVHLCVCYDGDYIQAKGGECQVEVKYLDTDSVEAACLAEIQLSPTRSVRQLQVHCRWEESHTVGRGRPEPSVGKNALRWENDSHTLVIASEDVESLKKQAELPSEIHDALADITPDIDHLVYEYKDDGFIVRLSSLGKNESISLKFLIVRDTLPERSPAGTWSIVTVEPW